MDYSIWENPTKRNKGLRVKKAPKLLERNQCEIIICNNGQHIIVEGVIDFWPSTNKWIVRGEKKYRYGIMELLDYVNGMLK